MKLLRLPGRFEWKILLALFTVASLPLGATAYLMSVTIGRVEAITDQHQEAVRKSLGGAVEVYKAYFEKMKDSFHARTAEIAASRLEHAADLADVPDLLHARILSGARAVDEWSAPPAVIAEAREAPPNLVALPETGGEPRSEPRILELTFGIPREIYANFLALRAAMEEEHELDRLLPVVLPRIFHGLGVALVVVLLIAAALGLFIARRATGRVATLSDAARRVGEGDLTVRVAPRGSDELDDLGRAFDRMVAELVGGAVAPRLHAEAGRLAGGRPAAGPRDQEPADADPARGARAGLEVPRRRSCVREAARHRAGDPHRGGRRHPPPGRRFLGVRQAPQGRAGAGRSRPGGR